MSFWSSVKGQIKELAYMSDQVDVLQAADKIKGNIWFKGPNVWILAFSIIIASVGLNVNSTAVIIGAMLISPLMGPIIGIGLSLGTTDMSLLKNAARNLLVMIIISLLASFLYFLLTPLDLANPTELEARTRPTIFDVLIALFGGLAGILESCRKEKGTVLSGVAIATALMPPLCTAGYGLAHGNWHYFSGAFYLFLINSVFIILATFVMVKYFHFPQVEFFSPALKKRATTWMSLIILAVIVPSVISAITVVRDNEFEKDIRELVNSNKVIGHSYIYDYKISSRKADLYFAGQSLTLAELEHIYNTASDKYGITPAQIVIHDHDLGVSTEDTDKLVRDIYELADTKIAIKDNRIKELEARLDSLAQAEIPYEQLAREVRHTYPSVTGVSVARGASVGKDDSVTPCLQLIAVTPSPLPAKKVKEMESWLRVRMNDTTAVVSNIVAK